MVRVLRRNPRASCPIDRQLLFRRRTGAVFAARDVSDDESVDDDVIILLCDMFVCVRARARGGASTNGACAKGRVCRLFGDTKSRPEAVSRPTM